MQHELPVRLAHRVVELENLPHGLSDMPSIKRVKDWYTQSFEDLINLKGPETYGVPLKALQAMNDAAGVSTGTKGEYRSCNRRRLAIAHEMYIL